MLGVNDLTHRYSDESAPGTYTTTVRATDGEYSTGTPAQFIAVTNAAPTILSASLDQDVVSSGGSVVLTGAYADAGAADTHTVDIMWGDG